jgi:hypothetical protein
MCDYSLMAFPNRLARENEELVVHRFPSGSMGLASVADLGIDVESGAPKRSFWQRLKSCLTLTGTCAVPAVCIPPGARLRVCDIGESLRKDFGVSSEEEVTFEQLSAAVNTYRDAIAFPNGRKVRLQQLTPGLRIKILDLGAGTRAEDDAFTAERELAELLSR